MHGDGNRKQKKAQRQGIDGRRELEREGERSLKEGGRGGEDEFQERKTLRIS